MKNIESIWSFLDNILKIWKIIKMCLNYTKYYYDTEIYIEN